MQHLHAQGLISEAVGRLAGDSKAPGYHQALDFLSLLQAGYLGHGSAS